MTVHQAMQPSLAVMLLVAGQQKNHWQIGVRVFQIARLNSFKNKAYPKRTLLA